MYSTYNSIFQTGEGFPVSNDHIFEILGVTAREDSYTDLLCHAINNCEEFRLRFLNGVLAVFRPDEPECFTRRECVPDPKTGQPPAIPDLILSWTDPPFHVLIENKIHSVEGLDQTLKYQACEADKYFYLTLVGETAKSAKFESITWQQILEHCNGCKNSDPKLQLLLDELWERLGEYYDLPQPKPTESLVDYVINQDNHRLVTTSHRFRRYVAAMCEREDLQTSAWQDHTGSHVAQWYHDRWKTPEIDIQDEDRLTDQAGRYNWNVHLEMKLARGGRDHSLTMFLHCETSPYLGRSFNKPEFASFREGFFEAQKRFREYIHSHLPGGDWRKANTKWAIAKLKLLPSTSLGELKSQFERDVYPMIDVIDGFDWR
ncbi:hypothetical protein GF420_07080 [candidate division GN15 bacterium]|nr:hypothetical protein [candidate division GN15 bacterium]